MKKDKFWNDLNRELWRSAVDNQPPRGFVRAELWRRVDHMRLLEKSASIRMARRTVPPNPAFRACQWLVQKGPTAALEMPSQSALDPQNAAQPAQWPTVYPAVDMHCQNEDTQENTDNYNIFVHAFIFAAQAAQAAGLDPRSFDLEFDFSKNRWVVQGSDLNPFAKISINFFYITAPPKIWNALFLAIVKNHLPSRKIAEKYSRSDQAQAILAVYADLAPLKSHDAYNLTQIFDDLNAEFFNNAIPRPILAWTSREQYRTLGSYNYHWDIILLSRLLNNNRIPEFVVRFILYHEMLHIKHGAVRDSHGLRAHTPAFRADERAFPQFVEAEKFISHIRDFV